MFAFQEWHSAIEMRRYLLRFIHHIDGIADLTALKFTRYNQYDSIILPIIDYLKNNGVNFQYDSLVTNVKFKKNGNTKTATNIELIVSKKKKNIVLRSKDDLVFITNGSCVENSTFGNNEKPAIMNTTIGPV
jgi:oleate hydratase